MLKNTFCHLSGVGEKTERKIWEAGVLSWKDFLDHAPVRLNPRLSAEAWRVEESLGRLEAKDPAYFTKLLPSKMLWRLAPEFPGRTLYLDIETNGLAGDAGYITTIATYDGDTVRWYVRGENLDEFRHDVEEYSVIVTYNGKCFDAPFIESHFGITLEHAHIDLRYVLASLGFKGGLKGCEKAFGIDRGGLDGVDGFFAVLLWNDYRKRRDPKALETLLAYNILDAVNLEYLLMAAYNMRTSETPFAESHSLALPEPPELTLKPDPETIERVMADYLKHRVNLYGSGYPEQHRSGF